jgi:alpha 1,3-glucosidase
MFTEFPDDSFTYAMDDQWMVGQSLLVKPVTSAGQTTTEVYLPGPESWYDLLTLFKYSPSPAGQKTTVKAPIERIPVFIRAGEIIPQKLRLRRSSKLMYYDPFTLLVVPTAAGTAHGKLYMDDEISLAHEFGASIYRSFEYTNNKLVCKAARTVVTSSPESSTFKPTNTVERIVLADQSRAPSKVSVRGAGIANPVDLTFVFDGTLRTLTIKKPDVLVRDDWEIEFEY